jgi:hypothetical protein
MKLAYDAAGVTTTTKWNRTQLQTKKERINYAKEESSRITVVGSNMN